MPIDDADLKRLRAALGLVDPKKPLAAMVALGRAAPKDARLTIDFAATAALGAPVVLVEPKAALDGFGLTPREREVAALLAVGLRNQQIARQLGITVATVKDHVHRVLAKTGLPSRAAVAARRRGP